jgi:hypothetical protein
MNIEELRELLKTDLVTVVFTKKDGTKREMHCTTISDYLPEVSSNTVSVPPKEDIVTVWDLEQNAWRSFTFSSIQSIETDYFNYVVESA